MNKTQTMSHLKLQTIPIRVVRTYRPREWTNFDISEQSGERVIRARTRKLNHGFPDEVEAGRIREGFMAIRDANDAASFFRSTGHFSPLGSEGSLAYPVGYHGPVVAAEMPSYPHLVATMAQISKCQSMIRRFIMAPLRDWNDIAEEYPQDWCFHFFAEPFVYLQIFLEPDAVQGVVRCHSGLSAIGALVTLEKVLGLEFRFCARTDCKQLYQVESRHFRKFCSSECAHLEAVRNSRSRKQKIAAPRRHRNSGGK
jgi:hypothetical protein